MIGRKDKYGLVVDKEIEDAATSDENPIIAALDKLNIKTVGRESKNSGSQSAMSGNQNQKQESNNGNNGHVNGGGNICFKLTIL